VVKIIIKLLILIFYNPVVDMDGIHHSLFYTLVRNIMGKKFKPS
jgi:hypothetical protein